MKGSRDLLARLDLGVRRHRILEVEHEAVGRQIPRLLQRPRVGSRHEQDAAARTGHGSISSDLDRNSGDIILLIEPKVLFRRAARWDMPRSHDHISKTIARGLSGISHPAAAGRAVTL